MRTNADVVAAVVEVSDACMIDELSYFEKGCYFRNLSIYFFKVFLEHNAFLDQPAKRPSIYCAKM